MSDQTPLHDDDDASTHPRFRERLAEVEDQSLRSRNRRLIALGIVILALLLAAAATQSALFDVDEVRIVGAERTAPEGLRSLAGVELGEPILGLDTDAIEDRLVDLPAVADVAASKSWRGVVTVEIDERLPVAWIDSLEGVILVASDGVVVEVLAPTQVGDVDQDDTEITSLPAASDEDDAEVTSLPVDVEGLPEIGGAMFSIEPGERVPAVLGDALVVASRLPIDVRSVTERVEITVDSLMLRVVGGGTIAVGDARDLDDKFEAVRAFLAQVDLSCLKTLDVRAPTVPVIVRNSGC